MKKVIMIGVVLTMLFMVGCSNHYFLSSSKNRKNAEAVGETIIDALNNQDAELLKSVLSEKALNTEDIDDSIAYCFELLDGNISSFEKYGFPESGSLDSEQHKQSRIIEGNYKLITNSGNEYYLYFVYCAIQDFDETEVGVNLLRIRVIDGNEYKSLTEYGRAGIYNPKWDRED